MVRKFPGQKVESDISDPLDFRFHPFKFALVPERCPVCRKSNSRILLSLLRNPTRLVLMNCRKCRSIYYPNAKAPDYEVVEDKSSFYMRIDQAEGIDSSIMPIFSVPSLKDFAVIDIGCGLGFTSDFIRYQGRECLAFDPSSAAKIYQRFQLSFR
jgi:2-polyprenyl-3-methyl-5-hydroxy-6-metoxy-1,4-benzoquinol methylase